MNIRPKKYKINYLENDNLTKLIEDEVSKQINEKLYIRSIKSNDHSDTVSD